MKKAYAVALLALAFVVSVMVLVLPDPKDTDVQRLDAHALLGMRLAIIPWEHVQSPVKTRQSLTVSVRKPSPS